jgi:iron complex outermembrane receptor protein
MSRRNDISRIAMTAAGLGAALIGPSVSYSAQPGVAQAVEEVLVTARRREESLQEVPIAISAFGGDALEERGVQRIENMNAVAPNLSVMGGVNTGESQASFRVRGLPGVAVYIDGVNQATTDGLLTTSVVEVERIEVLRGPQGTLFGNASLGGAVHYVTKAPGDKYAGKVEASLGSFARRDVQASFDIPLSDTFKTKFTGASQRREGFVRSTLSDNRYGDVNDELYRADFLWTPTSSLRFRYNVESSITDRNGPGRVVAELAPENFATIGGRRISTYPLSGVYAAVGIAYNPQSVVSGYPGGVLGEYDSKLSSSKRGFTVDQVRHTLDATWNINDTFTVRSITGYKDLRRFTQTDLDGSAQVDINERETGIKAYSLGQEVQLLGNHERVNWVLGAYYQQEYNRTRNSGRTLAEFTCDLWGADKQTRGISAGQEASCFNNRAQALGVLNTTVGGQNMLANGAMSSTQIGALATILSTRFSAANQPAANGLDMSVFSNAVGANVDSVTIARPESRAVFGDITFHLTDKLTLAGGLRYSKDDSNGTINVGAGANRGFLTSHTGLMFDQNIANYFGINQVNPLTGAALPAPTNALKFDALTKRLTVQYQWNPELMTYVSYSDGYGPGGVALLAAGAPNWLTLNSAGVATAGFLRDIYNTGRMDVPVSIVRDEQTVTNFEVGMRADWLGGALRTNVTAFYTTWKNIPVSQYIVTKYWDTDGNGFADSQVDITGDGVPDLNYFANLLGTSVSKAEVKGVEIETNWRATDNLRVNLNVGFLDTKYKDLGQGGVGLSPAVAAGSEFAQAPKFTTNLGLQYSVPFEGGAGLTPRVDYTYTDDFTLTPNEQNQRIQKGFGLLNARVTYDSGSNWSVSALGTNLTNEYYLNSGFYTRAEQVYFTTTGRPREWGVTFDLKFD